MCSEKEHFSSPVVGYELLVTGNEDQVDRISPGTKTVPVVLEGMTVKALKIGGQKVPFDEWFSSWMHLLVAHTMITLVDPIVCVICSSEYRKALYEILPRAERGNNINPVTRRP